MSEKPKSLLEQLLDILGNNAEQAVQESRIQVIRFVEGEPQILCPFCENWLSAKVSNIGLPEAHTTVQQSTVLEFSVSLDLCVHDHECAAAADTLKDAVAAFKKVTGGHTH